MPISISSGLIVACHILPIFPHNVKCFLFFSHFFISLFKMVCPFGLFSAFMYEFHFVIFLSIFTIKLFKQKCRKHNGLACFGALVEINKKVLDRN